MGGLEAGGNQISNNARGIGMKIAFRVDSSAAIGSGHLMRCLTLAGRFRKKEKADIYFISRDLVGSLHGKVEAAGFVLHVLPRHSPDDSLEGYAVWLTVPQALDAAETKEILQTIGMVDCLVVDSYALDIVWEREMRPLTQTIFVIDDLANRVHDCDVLLDQGFHVNGGKHRYSGLIPASCRQLLGPRHALLREEFYEARKRFLRHHILTIKRILVFYGGADATDETSKAITALIRLHETGLLSKEEHRTCVESDFVADIIVGGSNPQREAVRDLCRPYAFLQFHCQVDNMAEYMSQADLMLGASGTTTFERCYLGLPALVTSVSDNQHQSVKDLFDAGVIFYLGKAEDVTVENIVKEISLLNPEKLEACRLAGEHLMGIGEDE